jgi:hypothetical protein
MIYIYFSVVGNSLRQKESCYYPHVTLGTLSQRVLKQNGPTGFGRKERLFLFNVDSNELC